MKDVPAELAPGLAIVAVPTRADPRDAIVSRDGSRAGGAAAGQPRRHVEPAARLPAARGARRSLRSRSCAATSTRGCARSPKGSSTRRCSRARGSIAWGSRRASPSGSTPTRMLPAIGQGALALEARADDARVVTLCRALADRDGGGDDRGRARAAGRPGRRLPHAGRGSRDAGRGTAERRRSGRPPRRVGDDPRDVTGAPGDAAALGAELARRLLARGADRILRELETPAAGPPRRSHP